MKQISGIDRKHIALSHLTYGDMVSRGTKPALLASIPAAVACILSIVFSGNFLLTIAGLIVFTITFVFMAVFIKLQFVIADRYGTHTPIPLAYIVAFLGISFTTFLIYQDNPQFLLIQNLTKGFFLVPFIYTIVFSVAFVVFFSRWFFRELFESMQIDYVEHVFSGVMEEKLEPFWESFRRYNDDLTLYCFGFDSNSMDIDLTKQQKLEDAMRAIAIELEDNVRSSDFVTIRNQFNGAVLLTHTDLDHAAVPCERLYKKISALQEVSEIKTLLNIDLKGSAVSFHKEDNSKQDIITRGYTLLKNAFNQDTPVLYET